MWKVYAQCHQCYFDFEIIHVGAMVHAFAKAPKPTLMSTNSACFVNI